MINKKSFSVIDQDKIKGNIHIIGVGALGSMIGINLVRLNLASKLVVHDFDVVEETNLNNQAYLYEHIGMTKVEAFQDLASKIDPLQEVRGRIKKVDTLATNSNDVVVVAVDDFQARAKIIKNLRGIPLLICGGISSIGGNIEVVRGDYSKLAAEYDGLESGQEYDENDLTACGSPISIFHRIAFASSIACDQIIAESQSREVVNRNIVFDTPNCTLFEIEG